MHRSISELVRMELLLVELVLGCGPVEQIGGQAVRLYSAGVCGNPHTQ